MEDRFKFRAWDVEEKKYLDDDDICIDTQGEISDVYHFMSSCLEDEDDYYIFEQCTGLKDRNGKLIYEGDILCLASETDKDEYVVNWYEHNAQLSLDVLNGRGQTDFDIIGSNYLEIIGNIHENPELMEEK